MQKIAKQVAHHSLSQKHKIDNASQNYSKFRYTLGHNFMNITTAGQIVCHSIYNKVNIYRNIITLLDIYEQISNLLNYEKLTDKDELVRELRDVVDNADIFPNDIRLGIEKLR